jgi:hypothetical protein
MAADPPIERPVTGAVSLPNAALALSGLAGVAGTIHLVATVEHVGIDWELALFFALVGAAQLAGAWWIYRRPEDLRMLKLLAVGSVVVALLWVWSRTTGMPFGPEIGRRKVGVGDTIATLFELGFVAIVATIHWRGERAVAWLNSGFGVRLTCAILPLGLLLAAVGGHQH